ncbi:hypothetical protein BASA81_011057 [Batrachochytrium salamandrivorans]|nr:hypothetical protein BASA81_011057 [Batrachochytrium salamandrivorans]
MLCALGGARDFARRLSQCIGRFYCRSPQRRADQQEDMLSCCRRAARRDDRPSFGEGDKIMPRDEALERFDQLRVREVSAKGYETASVFLAKFQSSAASLQPDERIKLEVAYPHESSLELSKAVLAYPRESSMELLKAVISDPQANKICSLQWDYSGEEDVNSIAPLLISSCPELASLEVCLKHHSVFDFVSSLLEHPSNKLKELVMLDHPEGDLARFFAALGQSQVSALALCYSPKFAQGLYEYLARDLLVRLDVWMGNMQVPSEMMMSLVDCTRLVKLEMLGCEFSQWIAFPKSTTKLVLHNCTFVGGFDWPFLAGSNVRELDLSNVNGVDGNQLGSALAVRLRAKGLDKLRLFNCGFVNKTLIAVGVEFGQIKMLEVYSNLSDASVKLIALALQSMTYLFRWQDGGVERRKSLCKSRPKVQLRQTLILSGIYSRKPGVWRCRCVQFA